MIIKKLIKEFKKWICKIIAQVIISTLLNYVIQNKKFHFVKI